MTKEEAIEILEKEKAYMLSHGGDRQAIALLMAIEAFRDMKEIREIIDCDADTETKCNMISSILIAKPHYFEKQEPKVGQSCSIQVPDNATNGDVIKAMFPSANIWGQNDVYMEDEVYLHKFDANWWDAPYKTESGK